MAGSKSDYDHYCRDLSCDLWKHPKSIHQFHQCRPGKDQTDLYTARNQVPCLDQSRPSGKRACDHQQHESQYRIVSGGVIIGEFLAARSGLGYLIIYSSQVFKMDWLLMSIVLLCIMAMGLYTIINIVEKQVTKRY